MLTGSQRNGLGDTIREETCSCGLTRWQHADLAASYILSIKATNKLVHEKIYFSAAVSYLHLSLFHCCIYLCSVNLRRAGKKGPPVCHCGSWDADKDRSGGLLCGKGTKELVLRSFPSSPLQLKSPLWTGMNNSASESDEEKSSVN